MPSIGESIILASTSPNFARDRVYELSQLKNAKTKQYDIGHIVYCMEDGEHYIFRGSDTAFDDITGYFKKMINGVESISTLIGLKNVPLGQYEIGQIIYCLEDGKQYVYVGDSIEPNEKFGYFKRIVDGIEQIPTLEVLKKGNDNDFEIGQIVYCLENDTHYIYKGSGIGFDENTGYFKKMAFGVETIPTVALMKSMTTDDYQDGQLIYCAETGYHYKFLSNQFDAITGHFSLFNIDVHVGPTEPQDINDIWFDTEDETLLDGDTDENIINIKNALQKLQLDVDQLTKLITIGIVPGEVTDSYRRDLMKGIEPEEPTIPEDMKPEEEEPVVPTSEEDSEESGEVVLDPDKPTEELAKYTVNCVCAKRDTASNFAKNKADLVDGELLFYTDRGKFAVYYGGKFYVAGSSADAGGSSSGITVDELYKLPLEYLMFTNGDKTYKASVDKNGEWVVKEYIEEKTIVGSVSSSWGNYVSQYLCMNTIYCGGNGSEDCLVSHNFVELANASNDDINLNGIYLLYSDNTKEDPSDLGYIWKVLPLSGVIRAGSTFLIRGAQCNKPKSCFIEVKDYDMEWYDGENLISFNQGPASFYLCAGESFQELLDSKSLSNPWVKTTTKLGYIDSCGFGLGSVGEGSATYTLNDPWDSTMFIRWYMLEPAKQGNKAYSSRSTTALWTHINLEKQTTKLGNSKQYYYQDYMKRMFAPKASWEGKNFFTNKNDFVESKPNMLNITFGIQATDAGEGATRCFNWVSVGYYDEFLQYRKKGTDAWTTVYSIVEEDASNPDYIKKFIEHYRRLRWKTSSGKWVTSHKCIVKGLTAGEYEYKVGREDDSSYQSDILTFKVHSNDEVKNFSFIQTSDQQGFNWAEYTAWKKSSHVISQEPNWNFTINTGDATQSGNRTNEWYDYYEGRQFIRNKEEMYSIGNNDLCGKIATELTDGEDATSKYNHINVLRYFTFELDPNNDYSCIWKDEKYPIYSLYSFNYGDYHFISLNSEIAKASSKMYKDWQSDTYAGDDTFAKAAGAAMEDWLKKDLQIWTGKEDPTDCSKCVVYMHEMPFTIVTWSFMSSSSSARAGSKLNTLNNYGDYRFSRLFKKYGIRLVMGGHKHTYSLSKPIYDAPIDYITENHSIKSGSDLMDGDVDGPLSRIPVIQVTREEDILDNEYARYELVDKINAPVYVMSQATGYKLVSNKEQPSGDAYTIPWLMAYFKAKTNAASPTENRAQHMPMYIKYDLSEDEIKVTAKQVWNVWNVNVDLNKAEFDMNSQLTDITSKAMTLSTISDEDKLAYDISDTESYTIKL